MARKLRMALLGSLVFAGAAPLPVLAQAQSPPQPIGATPAKPGDFVMANDIVVTAQKRAQKVLDVPASVSVVSGLQLERMQSTQLADWAGYVPGLNIIDNGAPGETTIAIDGVGPLGAASEVGLYVNDTPIGSSSSFEGSNGFSIDLMPYDLDRAEVLRGPQGTLYGASTMGGLIKYVLSGPSLTVFSARVGGDVFGVQNGSGPGGGGRAEVNLPLIDNTLGLRISGYDQTTPGYIDDLTTGQKGDNPLHQAGGRVSALWEPTPDIALEVSAIYQKSHAANESFVALNQTTGQPLGGDLSNLNTRAEPYTQELQLYDATFKWDLHWADLTSITSYQQFNNDTVQDFTNYIGVYLADFGGTAPGQSDFFENYRLQKFTQEVRLASPTGGRLEWLVGAFYTHETGVNDETINAYDASGAFLPALNPLEFVQLPSTYEEAAVFGDATYHFTNWFDLTAGLRYAHNNQTFTELEGGLLVNPAAPTMAALDLPGKSGEGVVTYSVSPRVHLNHDTMLYARIASGYQPGGPNAILPGSTGIPNQFNSATLTDYQAGLKATFLDGHATADLSAFYIDWTRIQVSVLIGSQSVLENAGAARSQGMSFSGTYAPIHGLTLGANLAYTDAYLTTPVASIGAGAGARLPGVPLWGGSLTADYSFTINSQWRGVAGAGYRYTGSQFSDVEGSTSNGAPQGYPVKAYQVVDLHLGAIHAGWSVSLFAKNLFDDRAYLAPSNYFNDALGQPIDIRAPVLQPRTVGVSLDTSF